MAERAKKVCYYELLGLDRKCEAAEIKTTYRRLALKMHPDKAKQNGLDVDEATRMFQQIQEAHSVLSDVQERAWYDAHREQILKGDDEPGEDPFRTKINLYRYFSTGCFSGFGDDSQGFFAVYADLFHAIDTEEKEWEDADEEFRAMPPFGNSTSEWADVASFYKNWLDFCSRKAFGYADKWNPKDAQNRQVRRAMEQENKKARQVAKKEFNAEVRQLVRFVQKRDPRVEARQKQQMKAEADKAKRDLAQKEERKLQEAQERQQKQEAKRQADEERWAEAEAAREARRARGEAVSDDESNDDDNDVVEYSCEACRKTFKSEKAFAQHEKSKKHLQLVSKLRAQLERDLAEEEDEEDEDDEEEQKAGAPPADDSDVDLEAGAGTSAAPQSGLGGPPARNPEKLEAKAAAQDGGEDSEGSEGSDEDEDDFLARFAANQKKREPSRDQPSQKADPVEDSDESSGSDGGEVNGSGGTATGATAATAAGVLGGKKAQKKAKLKAIMLEKKMEKEAVQELVNSCRKAASVPAEAAAEASGEAVPEADAEGDAERRGGRGGKAGPAVASDTCSVCGEVFLSRTKLFQHIRATGHAALKEPVEPTRRKKR